MEIKENTVYNCDCLELMREMEKWGIIADWLITDPPYGIGIDGQKNKFAKIKSTIEKNLKRKIGTMQYLQKNILI